MKDPQKRMKQIGCEMYGFVGWSRWHLQIGQDANQNQRKFIKDWMDRKVGESYMNNKKNVYVGWMSDGRLMHWKSGGYEPSVGILPTPARDLDTDHPCCGLLMDVKREKTDKHASLATDSNEDEHIRREFDVIREQLAGAAKSVPDDKDELLEEKEDWMQLWVDLTTCLEACITVGRGKGIVLGLSVDEVIAGDAGQSMYEHFCGQVSALKAAAIRTPEPIQQDTTSVATGMVTRKKSVMECMSAKAPIDPMHVVHTPPCTRCQGKELVCEGPKGQGCTSCRTAKQSCDYATGSCSAAHREKADVSRASAVSASVSGSIRRTVSSPTLDSAAKDASSDGESEVAANLPPRCICPRPTRQTNKGKGRAINVDEYEDEKSKMRMENDELHHGLRLVQGKLLKMYELAYDLVDDLKKMEAKLVDRM
ncbi:uncharacterized protein EDB91DRAFT_1080618 [Suillus paluster]|uniref:uncharacterized protein n=1 Tax=Suillus paluster TaxID=48578 RepID=UPI001B85B789|nr:uncharacterized protein EDB91DRAFT_1080618 [Suillus paluster]KAG1745126.1 hypothetical protein EDB91DRAFT_1080618 [Suillus paluster]